MNSALRTRLWQQLLDAGLVSGPLPPPAHGTSPWYIRLMLGIAGWIGAIFVLVFLGATLSDLFRNETAAGIVGLGMCAAAWLLYHQVRNNDFASQFAFAISLTGQCLVAFAIGSLSDGVNQWAVAALALAVFELALALLITDTLHRTWCALAGALLLWFALATQGLSVLAVVLMAAGMATVKLHDRRWIAQARLLQPVGNALAVALAVVHAIAVMVDGSASGVAWEGIGVAHFLLPAWLGTVALAGVLAGTSYYVARELDARASSRVMVMAAVAVVAVATRDAPGIITGLLIVVVGFAASRSFLVGLGIVTLLGYLSFFYYSLQQTLLHKSIILAVTGGLLLLICLVMTRTHGKALGPDEAESDA